VSLTISFSFFFYKNNDSIEKEKHRISHVACLALQMLSWKKKHNFFFIIKKLNRCPVEKSYAIPPHDGKWDWSLRCICSPILFVLSLFFSPRVSG
jgi:hypothetical protein